MRDVEEIEEVEEIVWSGSLSMRQKSLLLLSMYVVFLVAGTTMGLRDLSPGLSYWVMILGCSALVIVVFAGAAGYAVLGYLWVWRGQLRGRGYPFLGGILLFALILALVSRRVGGSALLFVSESMALGSLVLMLCRLPIGSSSLWSRSRTSAWVALPAGMAVLISTSSLFGEFPPPWPIVTSMFRVPVWLVLIGLVGLGWVFPFFHRRIRSLRTIPVSCIYACVLLVLETSVLVLARSLPAAGGAESLKRVVEALLGALSESVEIGFVGWIAFGVVLGVGISVVELVMGLKKTRKGEKDGS